MIDLKKQCLTVKQIAKFMQMSQSSIMDDIRSGRLPAMQYNKRGKWLIIQDDFDKWCESKKYIPNESMERASKNATDRINKLSG